MENKKIDIILEKDPKRDIEKIALQEGGWALKERYKYLLENISRHCEILEKANTIAYRFSKPYKDIGKLLRIYLLIQGEKIEELFMRDVINLAKKRISY